MNLSITDDITFRKLTIFMMFVEKSNIARTAEALHTLEENVRCPLFVLRYSSRYKGYRCGRQHRNRSLRYVI